MKTVRPIRSPAEAALRLAPFDPVIARAIAQKNGAPASAPDLPIRTRVLLALLDGPVLAADISIRTGLSSHAVSSCLAALKRSRLATHGDKASHGRAFHWIIAPAGNDYLAARGFKDGEKAA